MRRSLAAPAVLLVLALLAGCGGDDGGDDASTPTTAGASSTTATVDVEAAPVCGAFGALLVGPLAEGDLDPDDPEQLAAAVAETQVAVDALRAGAPAEIAGPATAIADGYDAAFAVLATYGYDLARVDAEATSAEQAVLDAFGRPPAGPGAVDPYDELEAFVAARCAPGVTVPPDLTATTGAASTD